MTDFFLNGRGAAKDIDMKNIENKPSLNPNEGSEGNERCEGRINYQVTIAKAIRRILSRIRNDAATMMKTSRTMAVFFKSVSFSIAICVFLLHIWISPHFVVFPPCRSSHDTLLWYYHSYMNRRFQSCLLQALRPDLYRYR